MVNFITLFFLITVATSIEVQSKPGFLSYKDFRGRPYTVTYDERSFLLNGERSIFLGGSMHYPRGTSCMLLTSSFHFIDMWDRVLDQAVEDGLNLIQIYTFWNLHEPIQGQYNWEGLADLKSFLNKCIERGLFVNMRIGPYVCAEWDNGGIPVWLNYLDGIRLRANNEVWKREMTKWMKVLTDYTREYFADRGGPIILAQVENELEAGDRDYVEWCGDVAQSLKLNVPWMMCKGDTANSTINACNGRDCSGFLEKHGQSGRILIDQPACWTENEGWFQIWGGNNADPDDYVANDSRSGSNFAGGSYHNFYMYFGGNHYGRWAGNGITNWYADGVMIHADMMLNEPKHTHVAKTQHVIADIADILLHDKAQVNNQKKLNCPNCNAFEYKYKHHIITFIENNKNEEDKLEYRHVIYQLPAYSMVIIDENNNILFNTDAVMPVNQHRSYNCKTKLDFQYWNEPITKFESTDMKPVVAPRPYEQLNITRDLTEFLYYETTVDITQEETMLSIGGTDANGFVCYIDGVFMGADDQHQHTDGWHTMKIPIKTTKGQHQLVLLSESLGICNIMDSKQNPLTASQRLKGICGKVQLGDVDITNQEWTHYSGLIGEHMKVFSKEGASQVHWDNDLTQANHCAWFKASFKTPEGLIDGVEVLLHPLGMGRGQAYVNGHNIGRYWMIHAPKGDYTQEYYHIPKNWLAPEGEDNIITLGEVLGAEDPNVTICTTEYVSK